MTLSGKMENAVDSDTVVTFATQSVLRKIQPSNLGDAFSPSSIFLTNYLGPLFYIDKARKHSFIEQRVGGKCH